MNFYFPGKIIEEVKNNQLKRSKMERLEKYLIKYCAPTLASLKTANLFSYPAGMGAELEKSLACWNLCLRKKGIKLCMLQKKENALIYVYRTGELKRDLSDPMAFRILRHYGYKTPEEEDAIATLCARLKRKGFPHEIGLFLGYPPRDVIGFIHYGGRCCKCAGYWKVYAEEESAKYVFARFQRCSKAYMRLWQEGESIMQLAMAVPQN